MKRLAVLGALAFAGVLSQGDRTARASDLNVQGSSATGGNASVIRGTIGGAVNFSVTGAVNDEATVINRSGTTLPSGRQPEPLTIEKLAYGAPDTILPLERVSPPIRLPDGQTRVLLRIPRALEIFNGGLVELRRRGALIDHDRIELRR
jgi:hypothetical protein